MIERKTIVEQTELNCSGVLGVRIAFLLVDGELELDRKLHRVMIPADSDPSTQMLDVNQHLLSMEPAMAPVPQEDIDFVIQCHTMLALKLAQ